MTTAVILDLSHCGTSMLSGVIHRLGIPMVQANYRTHESRVEDADVLAALSSEATFKELCKERQGTDWGFKHPGAWRFEWMPQYLADPVYFAIYKEPISVTWRKYKQIDGISLLSTLDRMRRSVMGIEHRQLPCHYLSYWEAVKSPIVFTRILAAALRLEVDDWTMRHAAEWIQQTGGYNDG
jgi:hypothetical protein